MNAINTVSIRFGVSAVCSFEEFIGLVADSTHCHTQCTSSYKEFWSFPFYSFLCKYRLCFYFLCNEKLRCHTPSIHTNFLVGKQRSV